MVLLLTACEDITEPGHFGVSLTGSDVAVWFVNCYGVPSDVSLMEAESREVLWSISTEKQRHGDFPGRVVEGDRPADYELLTPLGGHVPPDIDLTLSSEFGKRGVSQPRSGLMTYLPTARVPAIVDAMPPARHQRAWRPDTDRTRGS